jgi:hypothetical protein
MSGPLTVVIGYDQAEDDAYQVCRASLLRHSSRPLNIVKLDQAALRRAGWYRRQFRWEGENRIDQGDLKPFSTDFAFTRFMVPALNLYQGWALFCDCDFLFTSDIAEVFGLADDKYALMCVQHSHDRPIEQTKMGGLVQSAYERKNWSSLCLWNCAHPSNSMLTGYIVNEWPGQALHSFRWLRDAEIGMLPLRWNWLAGVNPPLGITPSGIHFTLGVPSLPGCRETPYADLWLAERARLQQPKAVAA